MKPDRAPRETRTETRAETATTATTSPVTRKSWTRPDFTEVSACAEICAYVFRA